MNEGVARKGESESERGVGKERRGVARDGEGVRVVVGEVRSSGVGSAMYGCSVLSVSLSEERFLKTTIFSELPKDWLKVVSESE